jgi:2-oxoglutarate ferredoxin oxidoreductase subunit alpha
MNSAALKANLSLLKKGGIIIANTAGFDKKNLNLAKYPDGINPLEDGSLNEYEVIQIDVTKLVKEALSDTNLGYKDIERSKNMFVLGMLYWMYNRPLQSTEDFLNQKFGEKKPEIADANIKVLKAGYFYGETVELFNARVTVKQAELEPGEYRNITGNESLVLGLVAAARKSNLPLFFGSYPITPASDVLHGLAAHKKFGVTTFQAEDEIAAAASTIGASFGGSIGVTSSSGPGVALKGEAIGLAVMLELPMVVLNVQRAGPSTGMPTKTEQADLMQAVYGRNGESPLVVLAPQSPADCFEMAFEAVRISIEHMIPVMFLSDGYIANGSEPWKFPKSEELADINVRFEGPRLNGESGNFMPYLRDEKLVRKWAIPGTEGIEHRVGGLEKEDGTGNVSYDPDNHQKMTNIRRDKRDNVKYNIPEQAVDQGSESGETLVVGWGGTYGSIRTVVHQLRKEGHDVSHAHVKYICPFPKNFEDLLRGYDRIIVPEINDGQLVRLIRSEYNIPAIAINKVKGRPFGVSELKSAIESKISEKVAS